MAALAPGIILKLLNGLNSGTNKPVGEHRSALLQVTDIVPVDLDEKDLWPKHGFYIKVSDSSHSIYASLPFDQDDLVLSNKVQLGQFIYVDRLEPGMPVPVIKGVKPLPGRHPLIGTPEPIVRIKDKGEKSNSRNLCDKVSSTHRRGSWGPDQNFITSVSSSPSVVKPIALNFEDTSTPMKEKPGNSQISPMIKGRIGKEGSLGLGLRSSVGGVLSSKMADSKGESSALVRKSFAASKFSRSKSVCEREPRIPKSPLPIDKKNSATSSPHIAREKITGVSSPAADVKTKLNPAASFSSKNGTSHHVSFSRKLSILGKEAIQQRETAQRVALQALRDASASDTLVRVLKMFSDLSSSARTDAPAACFDQFLSFHQEIVQAVSDMETIQVATCCSLTSYEEEPRNTQAEEDSSVLHEIMHNSTDENGQSKVNLSKRRTTALAKSVSFSPGTIEYHGNNRHTRSISNQKTSDDWKGSSDDVVGDENKIQVSRLANSIKLAKQVQTETGNWFMEFLEVAVETGLKKYKGSMICDAGKGNCGYPPQSLILRVINWIEVEQCDSSKRPIHPKAAKVARKLRIKVKNP